MMLLRRVLPLSRRHAATPVGWRAMSSDVDAIRREFEAKVALGKTLPPLDDNMAKLEMYALFKQAQHGKNATPKPGMLDFVGKAKWEAWSKLGDMAPADAMRKYIAIIEDLAKKSGANTANVEGKGDTSGSATKSASSSDLLVHTTENGLLTIQLNRPTRFNAINRDMYDGIVDALQASATKSEVKAVLFKSTGAMFSSGNDLSMFTAPPPGQSFEQMAEDGAQLLERFVDAFITYPKPIVAAVQGPAVGISVTILALCDLLYVSEAATFHTPFTALGQSPEACSSLLLPRIMGPARANSLLLLGEKLTARDAVIAGFATEAFGVADFDKQVQAKVDLLLSRYPNAMQQSKALIRSPAVIEELKAVNRRECDVLKKLWLGPECMDAIMKFQSRKK
ncbi:hypothetical protein P43SY_000848 [Pythium insidiosum]|uniref:ACB domain-containing protein n=1 Tax=Pythium insidiosum TaxID=114742 RepID=A0AAD5LWT6_PYTIN|nr:hypothetical protein P43SY_000848 [Pythium insidiosum]